MRIIPEGTKLAIAESEMRKLQKLNKIVTKFNIKRLNENTKICNTFTMHYLPTTIKLWKQKDKILGI